MQPPTSPGIPPRQPATPARPAAPAPPDARLTIRAVAAVAAIALGIGVVLTCRLGGGIAWSAALFAWLPLLLALGTASQGFRFLRWHLLARRRAPHLPVRASLRIYLTGFALELTPGRVGAVLKFALLRQQTGVPEAETVGILPVEAATEVVSYLLIALAAAAAGGYRLPPLGWGVVVAVLALLGLALLGPGRHWLRRLGGSGLLGRVPLLQSLFDGLLTIGGPLPPLIALGCAMAARVSEVALFFAAARLVGLQLSPAGATLAWGASGLAGGLSLLPGGVGAAEGAIVATAVTIGGQASPALAAALLSRAMTVWLWVPAGLGCALASTRRRGALTMAEGLAGIAGNARRAA